MKKALELAALGAGFTSPNPMVGAVIVNKGRIVGIGYHKKKGDKHAEIRAIEDASGHLDGSTLYVNLEPCTHHGATPPCAPVIAKVGIKRVVIANLDPNPLVNGSGVEYLRTQGIDVKVGIFAEEGEFLNRFFFKYMKKGLPYVILKIASTLDGYIADVQGNSKWITGEDAREYVHKLRGEVDAIMVGKGTVLKDDPELTPKYIYAPKLPYRIIVSRRAFESFDYKIFKNPEKLVIVTSVRAKWDLPKDLGEKIAFIRVSEQDKSLDMREALKIIGSMGIQSIMCEGGSFLMGELIKQDLADELLVFYSPLILGTGLNIFTGLKKNMESAVKSFKIREVLNFQKDIMVRFIKYE